MKFIHSYFEKGCPKKCTRQSRKVLWVVLSSPLITVQKNLKEWHERPRTVCLQVLKKSNKSRFDSYSVRNSVMITSHISLRDCRVHIFSKDFLFLKQLYSSFIFPGRITNQWNDQVPAGLLAQLIGALHQDRKGQGWPEFRQAWSFSGFLFAAS